MHFTLFPSFFEKPQKITFAEQEKNEVIELFLRQHPIVNIPWILTALFAAVLAPLVLSLDQSLGFNFTINIPTKILIAGLILYYLLILAYVVEQFLHWYFNIYIVTNIHIVDVDFDSLLYRNITEINLTDIETVSAKVAGVFGSLFNYGDVNVETAAKMQAVTFLRVPRPDFVADRIEDLRLAITGGGGP